MTDKWNQRARRLLQSLVGTNTSPSAIEEVAEALRKAYLEGLKDGATAAADAAVDAVKTHLGPTDLRGGFIVDGQHQKKNRVE